MKTKTTVRYHFMLVIMAIVKMTRDNKCWRVCRENDILVHFWWDCKLTVSHYGK